MSKKPSISRAFKNAGKLTLHRNLSFDEYFSSYSRDIDGRVRLATYSFNDNAFKKINKLMPFSIFYISERHKPNATRFLRRFPHYLVYIVEALHTKCVYYELSGKALIGSQNLFSPLSAFEELSCEMEIENSESESFISLAFDFASAKFLRVAYDTEDLRIYGDEAPGVKGRPYLPCQNEVDYWSTLSNRDCSSDAQLRHFIYLVLEYNLDNSTVYLAFDRHYQFCGELHERAFNLLVRNYAPRYQKDVFLPKGTKLRSTSPFKDQIAKYHPVCHQAEAVCAYYFDY